jgi:hypothetical protein
VFFGATGDGFCTIANSTGGSCWTCGGDCRTCANKRSHGNKFNSRLNSYPPNAIKCAASENAKTSINRSKSKRLKRNERTDLPVSAMSGEFAVENSFRQLSLRH